jgi:ferredoxin-type protein NapH
VSQLTFLAAWLFLLTGIVCTFALGPGLAMAEPLGVIQLVFARLGDGKALSGASIPILLGAILFIGMTLILGRVFCAWSCPLGTAIDLIDSAIQRSKFKPLFARKQSGKDTPPGIVRNGINKYAFLASALAGSAVFRSPVWCSLCPIGTLCRGAIAGQELTVGAELLALPAVGAMSLGEKRFWCRYLCPVGGLLTLISRLNPFIKPRIKPDASRRNCGACQVICPEGIDVCTEKSFAKCTKCMECYVRCPFGSVSIGWI